MEPPLAPEKPLAPEHFYRATAGLDYVSPNYRSDSAHDPDRIPLRVSASDIVWEQYRKETPAGPLLPWGRTRSYGGLGPVLLPEEYRPKDEPPSMVEKGHKHFGSGIFPFPRGDPVTQYYKMAPDVLSKVRAHDELVPRPQNVNVFEHVSLLPFPANQPYSSHTARGAMFPSTYTQDDPQRGGPLDPSRSLHPQVPANPAESRVISKTYGSSARQEVQNNGLYSDRQPMQWHGNTKEYSQEQKLGASLHGQFYPTPPKTLKPDLTNRATELAVDPRTANAMRNCEKQQMTTHYTTQFTGYGNSNSYRLDNWEDFKAMYERDRHATAPPLSAHGAPTFIPPRPLNGRIARLINNRPSPEHQRQLSELAHYEMTTPDKVDANKELVDDYREYKSLPANYLEVLAERERLVNEHANYSIHQKLDKLFKTSDQSEEGPAVREETMAFLEKGLNNRVFMESVAQRHQLVHEQLEAFNKWKLLSLSTPQHEMNVYRHKLNFVVPVEQPNTFYDNQYKIWTARAPFLFVGENPYVKMPTKYYMMVNIGENLAGKSVEQLEAEEAERKLKESQDNDVEASNSVEGEGVQESQQPQQYEKEAGPKHPCVGTRGEVDPAVIADIQPGLPREQPVVYNPFSCLYRSNTVPSGALTARYPGLNSLAEHKENVLGGAYSHLLGRPYNQHQLIHLRGRLEPNCLKSEVVFTPKEFFRPPDVTERVQFLCPTFSPEQLIQVPIEKGSQTSRADTASSLTQVDQYRRVKFDPNEPRCSSKEEVESTRYKSQGSLTARPAIETIMKPAYTLDLPLSRHYGARLADMQNSFSRSKTQRDFRETFPENAPDLRDHISHGKRHSFYGYNGQVFHG